MEQKKNKQQKIKQSRNDDYQIQVKQVPEFISLDQFVEARAHELKHFVNILQKKYTTKLTHQLLPRHLRRRAMSHNYYRIPIRLRYKALTEMLPSEGAIVKRSRCRKHRRKPAYLLNLYENRQRKAKWLETHIWHAKRFKMVEKWGHRIASQCTDKSERAVYRMCGKQGCLIYDRSYYRHFLVSGTWEHKS